MIKKTTHSNNYDNNNNNYDNRNMKTVIKAEFVARLEKAEAEEEARRKGTNGVSTNGVTATISCFLTEGLVWYAC